MPSAIVEDEFDGAAEQTNHLEERLADAERYDGSVCGGRKDALPYQTMEYNRWRQGKGGGEREGGHRVVAVSAEYSVCVLYRLLNGMLMDPFTLFIHLIVPSYLQFGRGPSGPA